MSTDEPASKKGLTKSDYKTIALSSLGGTLEFYDFVIYALYINVVIKPLFMPAEIAASSWGNVLAWGGFAVGYIARPIGGMIMAHFGDLLGRKKMFMLSVIMMALPTLFIGLLPTYQSIGILAPILLVLLRIIQGAAIGGEMPGAWVFIGEHVPKRHYGLGIGTMTSGIAGGIFLGFLVTLCVDAVFTETELRAFAWRIAFILGGIFGIIAVFLRRFLSETPIFQAMARRKALAKEIPIMTVLKNHQFACVIVGLLTWSLSTTVMLGVLMTPDTVLKGIYNMPSIETRIAGLIVTTMLVLGCITSGFLEDRVKTRATSVIFWGGLIVSSLAFYHGLTVTHNLVMIYLLYGAMGFFAGATSLSPIISTRIFPPAIRYSGLSFAYNLAYAIFSAITPMLALYLLKHTPLGIAYYLCFISLLAIVVAMIPLAYKGYSAEDEIAPEAISDNTLGA